MQIGDYAGARPILEALVAQAPQLPEAHNLLGVCLLHLNDPPESAEQFRMAVKLEPHYENAWLNLGSTLFGLQDENGAVAAFNQLLELNPQSINGHLSIAKILLLHGNEVAATQHLEKVIQLDPHNTFALANAGLIESRRGHLDTAAAYISRALVQEPGSTPLQLALIELDLKRGRTTDATVLSDKMTHDASLTRDQKQTLAMLLLNSGLAGKGAELVSGDSDLSERFSNAAMARAKQKFLENKFRDTLNTLDAIRNLQTQDAAFHDLLGLAWYEIGNARRASDELQQAIKMDPRNPDRYFQLGLVYLKHHTPDLALLVFKQGLAQMPDSARLWLGLGLSQHFGDDTPGAQKSVEKALALDPGLVEGYVVLGDILESNGRLSEANEVFHQAIGKKPNLYIGYFYCGKVALEAGGNQTEQALAFFTKAIDLNPDFAEGHFERGRALEKSGKVQQAMAEYNLSLAKDESLSQAHYRLALLYNKLGQTQTANNELALFQKTKNKQEDSVLERLDYRIQP
jgi:tetratricopeptide (TPR) repeat protein